MRGTVPIDGRRIRDQRLGQVISRKQLAERAGLGYSTLANYETTFNTHAWPETVQRIAKHLRVKPQEFVDLEKL